MKPKNNLDNQIRSLLHHWTFLGCKLDTEALLISIKTAAQNCLLCNHPSSFLGVFMPNNPVEFGGMIGKDRAVFYGFCSDCFNHPDKTQEAESKLKSDLRVS